MASFNKTILVGNLTRDPELRYTPQGSAVADIGIAVNEAYTNRQTNQRVENVHFFDVTAWGKTAELVSQYCKKGSSILVEGKLTQDRWEDKQSGKKMSKVKIVAERVQFLGSKNGHAQDQGGGGGGQQAPEPLVTPDVGEDIPF